MNVALEARHGGLSMHIRTIVIELSTLVSDASGGIFIPCTDYMRSAGISKARMTVEIVAPTGGFEAQPALEAVNHADDSSPDVEIFGTNLTTAGMHYPGDMSALTKPQGKELVRWGFKVKNTHVSNPLAAGRVRAKLEIEMC